MHYYASIRLKVFTHFVINKRTSMNVYHFRMTALITYILRQVPASLRFSVVQEQMLKCNDHGRSEREKVGGGNFSFGYLMCSFSCG